MNSSRCDQAALGAVQPLRSYKYSDPTLCGVDRANGLALDLWHSQVYALSGANSWEYPIGQFHDLESGPNIGANANDLMSEAPTSNLFPIAPTTFQTKNQQLGMVGDMHINAGQPADTAPDPIIAQPSYECHGDVRARNKGRRLNQRRASRYVYYPSTILPHYPCYPIMVY